MSKYIVFTIGMSKYIVFTVELVNITPWKAYELKGHVVIDDWNIRREVTTRRLPECEFIIIR